MNTTEKRQFLASCAAETGQIHDPICDLSAVGGKLNPANLGYPPNWLFPQALGQSSYGFQVVGEFRGNQPPVLRGNNQWNYGTLSTFESVGLGDKVNALYDGNGAVVLPSGGAAIHAALGTIYLHLKQSKQEGAILVPKHVYDYVSELLDSEFYFSRHQVLQYSASEENFEDAINEAAKRNMAVKVVYIESPVSNRFEIYNLEFLTKRAAELGALTIEDSTFATYLGRQPIRDAGVNIVVVSGGKYMGGYTDCSYGAVICKDSEMADRVADFIKLTRLGTVAPGTAELAIHRLGSVDARMEQSYQTAKMLRREIFEPMINDGIADQILVYDPKTTLHPRAARQITRGNGLFTVVFGANVKPEQRDAFIDSNPLAVLAAGWGGHVTTVTIPDINGKLGLRVHAGLEDPSDLQRAFKISRTNVFGL